MRSLLPRALGLTALAAAAVACTPASIEEGEILDIPFAPASAIIPPPSSNQNEDTLVVFLSDDGDLCSRLKTGGPVNEASTLLSLTFAQVDDAGEAAPLELGEYEILSLTSFPSGAGGYGSGFFTHRESCEGEGTAGLATSGTLELTAYNKDNPSAAGSFSLAIKETDNASGDPDDVNGTFSASFCDYDVEQEVEDPCGDDA